jgi:hypothetical protein
MAERLYSEKEFLSTVSRSMMEHPQAAAETVSENSTTGLLTLPAGSQKSSTQAKTLQIPVIRLAKTGAYVNAKHQPHTPNILISFWNLCRAHQRGMKMRLLRRADKTSMQIKR